MKRILGMILAVCVALGCAACGNGGAKKPYASVEEFVNSPDVQEQLQEASEQ